MDAEPLLAQVRAARERGHTKLTLLGGEPTLQPAFLDVVREAVVLGFEEIVIFTNGVRTARAELVDEILATGGRFTWRISLQGATEEAHCRTTGKPRSFERILRTLRHLAEREQRVEVNMCVVGSNHESVPAFAELLLPHGVKQLHLDLMRPLDAGERSEEELRAMMPSHAALAGPLREMHRRFEERAPGFDLNIGNLPYCAAPELLHVIHHDGEHTETIAIVGDDRLSQPWNKYLVKRRDKVKPASCARCVMSDACSGVFETYARFHGTDALVPITSARLRELDPERRMLVRHLRPLARRLRRLGWKTREEGEASLLVTSGDARYRLHRGAGQADYDDFRVEALTPTAPSARRLADAIDAEGWTARVPLGEHVAGAPRSIAARLARLERAAPFPPLRWRRTTFSGSRAEAELETVDGTRARIHFAERDGKPHGGYEVDADTPAIRDGLRAALRALGR